jgi:hypothetical protein
MYIKFCPHCGHGLERFLETGMAICNKCQQKISSGRKHKLLSAAWCLRKKSVEDSRTFLAEMDLGLSEDELILVEAFVGEYKYSHEDFYHVLERLIKE